VSKRNKSPLLVNPDAVLGRSAPLERFEAIVRGRREIAQYPGVTRMIGEAIIKPFEKLVVPGDRAPTAFRKRAVMTSA
jgi:hypothetical protein